MTEESTMARILPIDTPTLGDRSYLVHNGRVAFVVDPQRDIDRVLDLAAAEGVRITHIFEEDGRPVGVFTGGSLLYGSVGRPDLLGPAHTHALVHHQYASAHRLASELPAAAGVYPTHGFGSFCSATQSEASASTLADEKRETPC
jgi:hydroxyacylglutathione hydrolase